MARAMWAAGIALVVTAVANIGAEAYSGLDYCAHINADPLWSAVHYMPTVIERTLRRKGGKLGPFTCPVCGSSYAYANDWKPESLRESGKCSICGEINRKRQLAYVVNHVCTEFTGKECLMLADVAHSGMSIFHLEASGTFHEFLQSAEDYVAAEWLGPQYAPGQVVDDVMNQDLQALTFEDNSFDLVISAEVFEHIPDPYLAHEEVFRVLKPGGSHVFTTPFAPNARSDIIKAEQLKNGTILFYGDPELHADMSHKDGWPTFRIFGRGEMITRLCDIGFQVMDYFVQSPNHGIIGGGAHVFRARKPPAGQGAGTTARPAHGASHRHDSKFEHAHLDRYTAVDFSKPADKRQRQRLYKKPPVFDIKNEGEPEVTLEELTAEESAAWKSEQEARKVYEQALREAQLAGARRRDYGMQGGGATAAATNGNMEGTTSWEQVQAGGGSSLGGLPLAGGQALQQQGSSGAADAQLAGRDSRMLLPQEGGNVLQPGGNNGQQLYPAGDSGQSAVAGGGGQLEQPQRGAGNKPVLVAGGGQDTQWQGFINAQGVLPAGGGQTMQRQGDAGGQGVSLPGSGQAMQRQGDAGGQRVLPAGGGQGVQRQGDAGGQDVLHAADGQGVQWQGDAGGQDVLPAGGGQAMQRQGDAGGQGVLPGGGGQGVQRQGLTGGQDVLPAAGGQAMQRQGLTGGQDVLPAAGGQAMQRQGDAGGQGVLPAGGGQAMQRQAGAGGQAVQRQAGAGGQAVLPAGGGQGVQRQAGAGGQAMQRQAGAGGQGVLPGGGQAMQRQAGAGGQGVLHAGGGQDTQWQGFINAQGVSLPGSGQGVQRQGDAGGQRVLPAAGGQGVQKQVGAGGQGELQGGGGHRVQNDRIVGDPAVLPAGGVRMAQPHVVAAGQDNAQRPLPLQHDTDMPLQRQDGALLEEGQGNGLPQQLQEQGGALSL